MSVCNAVTILACEVEEQLSNMTSTQREMLNLLKNMNKYCEEGRLDDWEYDFGNILSDYNERDLENYKILVEIFNFGAYNLYGKFDLDGTNLYYKKITDFLNEQGYKVSTDLDVSTW